uniref:TIR domain-containing protein n=1 Tax=Oreochromis niloticus TaxID=8128 RepID=A0A669BL60_ORENI
CINFIGIPGERPIQSGFSSKVILRYLVLLVLHVNPSLCYSLKNCSIDYFENPSADVSLDCSNRELVTVPDDIPRDAATISLFYNQLQKIHRGDFGDMPKLRSLSLGLNQIVHVANGAFIHLVALKTLSILFQGLSSLIKLDLSDNLIEFIHPTTFQHLISLETVSLASNRLQQVTDIQSILQLAHIQNLSIASNLFSSFQTKDLPSNMSSGLKFLDLSSNKLKRFSITTPIFHDLYLIGLSHNDDLRWDIPDKMLLSNITSRFKLEQFVARMGRNLNSLMDLRLNYMEKWNEKDLLSMVCQIPTLRILDLFNNHLTNSTGELLNWSQLTELDLSNTNIIILPKGSIDSMKQLKSLTLHTNMLTKVPDDIRSLISLEVPIMYHNLISEVHCEDFVNTTQLSELDLNSNCITKLDGCVFENLNDLKVLDLSHNKLFTVGETFRSGLQKLEFLDLSKKILSIVKKGQFQGLHSLKSLNVLSGQIWRVREMAFWGLENLESLILSLPLYYETSFSELQNLENLTISFKVLSSFRSPHPNRYKDFFYLSSLKRFTVICESDHTSFPLDVPSEMFQAMKHLEDFTAVNIYISAPHVDTFQFNPQIKHLTIKNTDLSDLDPELFPIPNLQVLDLSNSNLKSLDFLMQANLSFLPALTYLDLDNNPFTCDCTNASFIEWVKSNKQTQVVNAHQYTCSFPVTEQGNMLLDFDIHACWMDTIFLFFISSMCVVLLTLLTSFIYHFLRWQLVYAFQLLQAFIYDSMKRKRGAPHHYDAFISYNVRDEDWVYREILPVLEGEQGWRLCLHHRDFQPGKPIIKNITDAIYSSRKTICVISGSYLQSEWCSREIQMASFRLFDEKKDVLILLFPEKIPARQLSPYYRMRKLVKKRTYLSWPQAGQHPGVFWQNVRRALETRNENPELLRGPAGC